MTAEPDTTFAEEVDYNVSLPDFEGPLDLLLHLVKKHELEIFEIPIAFITLKYLQMLEVMRAMNIDIAAEYLVMAATLCHIKSRELLPKEALPEDPGGDEDEEDPRQALIRRLLEYQKYKTAAFDLGSRPVVGRNVFPRGGDAQQIAGGDIDVRGPLQEIPVWGLIEALEKILSRARVQLTHDVTMDRLSLADSINELTERLEQKGAFTFESCFAFLGQADGVIGLRGQIVVTFMAILEMAKLHLIRIYQATLSGSIYLSRPDLPPPPPEGYPEEHPADAADPAPATEPSEPEG